MVEKGKWIAFFNVWDFVKRGKPQYVVCRNVLRLAGELSIVRVLNDFQPGEILHANL